MCLIAVAYRVHPDFPLIIAANRDEFSEREAIPAHFWTDAPHILAGRDLRAGGTWMGVTRRGRVAAVTNHRDFRRAPIAGPSRGMLTRTALDSDPPLDEVEREGFNLLYGRFDALRYRSNISGEDLPVTEGYHGLSNALLNTPWPKVNRAVNGLRRIVESGDPKTDELFDLLSDTKLAADNELPDTGIGLEKERALSSIRIDLPGYGTHCSTVLLIGADGTVSFEERTWNSGKVVKERFIL